MKMAEASSSHVIGASRSIYYSLTDEVPGLTDEEKNKLESVMMKALEFEAEEENKMRQPLEGQLYKYTNVMKGWQYRWFVISPDTGMLEYYMLDERRKSRPRGALYLAWAVVSPSEEDNQSFVVSDTSGEVYKLKATDARERQIWVDKIRFVIKKHSSDSPEVAKTDPQTGIQNTFALCKNNFPNASEATQCKIFATPLSSEKLIEADSEKSSDTHTDTMAEIKESVYKALKCQKILAKSIEALPCSGPHVKCSDNKLLLVKAISQATVQSLEQCYLILRRHRQREALKSTTLPIAPSVDSLDKFRSSNVKKD